MNDIQNIKHLNIDDIFNDVVNMANPLPNSYPLEFDINSITEIFEFLLQFTTMLCKYFYGDERGVVDLTRLSKNDFLKINIYMLTLGFSSNFNIMNITNENLEYASSNRYDRIDINNNTKLKDLIFGLKCKNKLYIISFDLLKKN